MEAVLERPGVEAVLEAVRGCERGQPDEVRFRDGVSVTC